VLSSLAKSAVLKNSANNADIFCVRTHQLSVTLPKPQTMVIDGEIEETDHMTVSVIPDALKVIAPIRLSP
jgi:diacylglycerol kinase family enzyme